ALRRIGESMCEKVSRPVRAVKEKMKIGGLLASTVTSQVGLARSPVQARQVSSLHANVWARNRRGKRQKSTAPLDRRLSLWCTPFPILKRSRNTRPGDTLTGAGQHPQ